MQQSISFPNEGIHTTLTPHSIVEQFIRIYQSAMGQTPQVAHLFGEWYQVNGETVHRQNLFLELVRMRELLDQRQKAAAKPKIEKSFLNRIINKLKGM